MPRKNLRRRKCRWLTMRTASQRTSRRFRRRRCDRRLPMPAHVVAATSPALERPTEGLTMRLPVTFKALPLLLPLWLALFALNAHAAIDNADVLDSVLTRYQMAATDWAATITNSASWLFWLLVLISMVWTFGMMALRKADIGEFFAELVKFTMFTGFFWWLLTNGPNFAKSIMDSLRQIAVTRQLNRA